MLNTLELIKESVPCLLCGSGSHEPLHAELPAVRCCSSCGFVYTSPRITRESAARLYSQEYFESHSSQEMGYDNYVSDRDLVEKTFNRRLEHIEKKWRPGTQPGKVLDVGCAAGFFLNVARQRGWEPAGVEISEYCCRYAAENFGLNLINGAFEDYLGREAEFDLVTMWDYIEHSFVPDKDIAKARSLLRPGGMLVLATPDVGSWPARFFKQRWIGFKEHEHLYYFNNKSLCGLLRAKGFDVLETSYAGKFISTAFFAKRVKNYSRAAGNWMDKALSAAGLGEKPFYCNPFDIIMVVARKP